MTGLVVSRRTAHYIITHLLRDVAQPSARAFMFAYIYVVLPKLVDHGIRLVKNKNFKEVLVRYWKVMVNAIHPHKFPMFAASLVAGINVLEPIIYEMLQRWSGLSSPESVLFFATLVSAFVSAGVSFPRYQTHILNYGRYYSLDLTLLLATRALDTALSSTLYKVISPGISQYGDVLLFVASCTPIMFSWFYHPESLPPAYRQWITSAANMDDELIEALKQIKQGNLVYGEHGPHDDILNPICDRYGKDPSEGSFVTNLPISCELVHAYKTSNCELHALWRFTRGFTFALKVYGPLNALLLLFPNKRVSFLHRVMKSIKSTARSSAFLGAFIGLYWYAVCLSRTRLLPVLFPNTPRTRFDDTIGPSAGAFLCGFSSLLETAQRRKELALFVAPRALGTFVPSTPSAINLKLESLVFSVSLAILVAYSRNSPAKVRGIFGKGLRQVFHIASHA
ncbi:uncharacterized protein RJT21DRAFT_120422 [Scheffersomyces amazonensis]|uniref:uncharacterized protein n=1 Tax=Scheffersomyces amazonensis TaxID=1078765 RepID=UPI00315DA1F2